MNSLSNLTEIRKPSGSLWQSGINFLPSSIATITSIPQEEPTLQLEEHEEQNSKSELSVKDCLSNEETSVTTLDSETSWSEHYETNTWGTQNSNEISWDSAEKPYKNLLNYEKLHLNTTERDGILTDRIIGACSSYLDKNPVTGNYVLCKVELSRKNLSDISIITYHHFLQYVDLSWNELSNVNSLGELPFLMHLDVSHNIITSLLDFKPPFNLTYVNYSHNVVHKIPDLSGFWSIVDLNLSHNSIHNIEGLQDLKYLQNLDLSSNCIKRIENLNHMKLQALNLEQNLISEFDIGEDVGFKTLDYILQINVGLNNLTTLKLFKGIAGIQSINVIENLIDDLKEIDYLKGLNYLTKADFRGNPIVFKPFYTEVCLSTLKYVNFLDGESIDYNKKVSAKNYSDAGFELKAAKNAAKTLFLQQINDPLLGNPAFTFRDPLPPIIILVGPSVSNKGKIVDMFCKNNIRMVIKGVSYTTRNKMDCEIEGDSYYFMNKHEFKLMESNGEFLTVSQILGNRFGFSEKELNKVFGKISGMVLHTNLTGALTLRMKGVRCLLVLALPSSRDIHKEWLLKKYCNLSKQKEYSGALEVRHNLINAEQFLKQLTTTEIVKEIVEELINKTESDNSLQTEATEISACFSGMSENTVKSSFSNITGSSSSTDNNSTDLIKNMSQSTTSGILKVSSARNKESSVVDVNLYRASVNFQEDYTSSGEMDNYETPEEPAPQSRSVTFGNKQQKSVNKSNLTQESVSGTVIHGNESMILSVLSHPNLSYTDDDSIVDDTKSKAIEAIIEDILKSRETYLESHLCNPGLFIETIFTDNEQESLSKLKQLLKTCIQKQHHAGPRFEVEKDIVYQIMVATRLQRFHEYINNELSTTQKQRGDTQIAKQQKETKEQTLEHHAKKRQQSTTYKIPKETLATKSEIDSDESEEI